MLIHIHLNHILYLPALMALWCIKKCFGTNKNKYVMGL